MAGITIALGLINCGGGTTTSPTDTTNAYTGAGSKWDNTMNETAKTFSITHRPEANESIDFTIDGTFETLSSGFKKLTVTSTTGTNAPTCTDGVAQIAGATMYMTSNGGVIVHTEHDNGNENNTTDESVIAAFATETLTAKSDFDGTYAGILVSADASVSTSVEAVSVTCLAGTCTGLIIDPDTNATPTTGGGNATLNLTSAGFISGTMTTSAGSGNMTCMVDTNAANTTKTLISCSGQNPGATTELFNLLLVSQ